MEKKKGELASPTKQVSVAASPTMEKKRFEEKPITREHK